MNDDINIYDNPEKFGLEVVAKVNYPSDSYGFDIRVVWRQIATGLLFTARDAGCSCPYPFEDFDLTNIDRLDLASLENELRDDIDPSYSFVSASLGERMEFLRKVKEAINTPTHKGEVN